MDVGSTISAVNRHPDFRHNSLRLAKYHGDFSGDLMEFHGVFSSFSQYVPPFSGVLTDFSMCLSQFPMVFRMGQPRLGPEVGDRQTTLEPEISGEIRSFTQISMYIDSIGICRYLYAVCVYIYIYTHMYRFYRDM